MHGPRVVVVDDDLGVRQLVGDILEAEGAVVGLAKSGEEGIALLKHGSCDALFIDLRMPGRDGIATIEDVRRFLPRLPIVVITGFGSLESSVEAMRLGVADYVTKPITAKKISMALARAIAAGRRPQEAVARPSERANSASVAQVKVVAASPAMRSVVELAGRLAQVDVAVLIEGATGVGKELIAQRIHRQSARAPRRFVRMTCSAVREDQLESQLFGHVSQGTVAPGLLEQAHGGTLFLHSISELPTWFQGQLLEALQQGWFTRPGTDDRVEIDARVIASTSINLGEAANRGEFVRGLYYYLSIVPINIPSLQSRREDIRALVEHFIEEMNPLCDHRTDGGRPSFSKDAWQRLLNHDWPGNVRELANVVKRSLLLANGNEVALAPLAKTVIHRRDAPEGESITVSLSGDLKLMERQIIGEVIKRCRGNKAAAARQLGLHRKTLYRLLEADTLAPQNPQQADQSINGGD